MKSARTLGIFLIACAALCFIMAWDRYQAAVREAQLIADVLDGVEFESVSLPLETTVGGLVGVILLVAGARLVFESVRQRGAAAGDLLKPE